MITSVDQIFNHVITNPDDDLTTEYITEVLNENQQLQRLYTNVHNPEELEAKFITVVKEYFFHILGDLKDNPRLKYCDIYVLAGNEVLNPLKSIKRTSTSKPSSNNWFL